MVHHSGTENTESEKWNNLQHLDKDLLPATSRWRSQRAINHQLAPNALGGQATLWRANNQ